MRTILMIVAAAFAQVIDSKSPYTSGHSERVTLFTDLRLPRKWA